MCSWTDSRSLSIWKKAVGVTWSMLPAGDDLLDLYGFYGVLARGLQSSAL